MEQLIRHRHYKNHENAPIVNNHEQNLNYNHGDHYNKINQNHHHNHYNHHNNYQNYNVHRNHHHHQHLNHHSHRQQPEIQIHQENASNSTKTNSQFTLEQNNEIIHQVHGSDSKPSDTIEHPSIIQENSIKIDQKFDQINKINNNIDIDMDNNINKIDKQLSSSNSISLDRLTALVEPKSNEIPSRRATLLESSISNYQMPLNTGLNSPREYKSITKMHYYDFNMESFLAISSIIILLVCYITYKLYRLTLRAKDPRWPEDELNCSSLMSLCCDPTQQRKRSSSEMITQTTNRGQNVQTTFPKIETEFHEQQRGESSFIDTNFIDVSAVSTCEGGEADEIVTNCLDINSNNTCGEGTSDSVASKFVVLKRRLGKSSLVIAAQSARPKVKLMTAKMKKFIDDEIDGIRIKKSSNSRVSIVQNDRLLTLLTGVRRNKPNIKIVVDDIKDQSELMVNSNDNVSMKNTPSETSEILFKAEIHNEPKQANMNREKIELNETNVILDSNGNINNDLTSNKDMDQKITDDNYQEQEAKVLQLEPLHQLSNNDINNSQQKLSPVINDAYSSLSNCSLLSSTSPTINNINPCNCITKRYNNLELATEPINFEMRSKSQGNSPFQNPNSLNSSNPIPYRSCCSASPNRPIYNRTNDQSINMDLKHERNQILFPQISHARCLNCAEFQSYRDTAAITDIHKPLEIKYLSTGDFAEDNDINKCNNMIKRQYENYYDDEQSDVYHRLTASIGMQFDLNFGIEQDPTSLSYTAPVAKHTCNQCNSSRYFPESIGLSNQHHNQHHHHNQSVLQMNSLMSAVKENCKCCSNKVSSYQCIYDPSEQAIARSSIETSELPYKYSEVGSGLLENCMDTGDLLGNDRVSESPHNINRYTCSNSACSCRHQVANINHRMILNNQQANQMNVIIQQPSVTTPPPLTASQQSAQSLAPPSSILDPKEDERSQEICMKQTDDNLDEIKKINAPSESNIFTKTNKPADLDFNVSQNALAFNQLTSNSCRMKRKQGRLMNQMCQLDNINLGEQITANCNSSRRMSIACDRFTTSHAIACNNRDTNNSVNRYVNSQHRASIVSDDLRWFPSCMSSLNQNPAPQTKSTPHASQLHSAIFSSRPSDTSLYECRYKALNGRVSFGSSGGSSSGIGYSGSACTNTPTSAFPSVSFAANCPESLVMLQSNDQSPNSNVLPCKYQHQYGPCLHGNCQDIEQTNHMICQATNCQSRKLSLPVQLEFHSTERLSPNRNRSLFEKNQHQYQQQQPQTQQTQHYQQQNQNHHQQQQTQPSDSGSSYGHRDLTCDLTAANLPNDSSRPPFERRRSSQTITRQSSFWLEDRSADSIISLTTSGLGDESESQVDLNSCPPDEVDLISEVNQTNDNIQQQSELPQISSQRPSISSLVLSGDSIESVKRKPIENMRENIDHSDDFGVPKSPEERDPHEVNFKSLRRGCDFRDRKGSHLRSFFERSRGRLPSSSTSSTTSSPSPDFSKPSERILALAANSATISKRHLFSRLRSRRHSRHIHSIESPNGSIDTCKGPLRKWSDLSGGSGQQKTSSKPDENQEAATNCDNLDDAKDMSSDGDCKDSTSKQAEVPDGGTNVTENLIGRPASDHNSTSLERQCRDLWKLRATLHDDAFDDWSSYHQRLNRRYDSGYKSIENQLSSSIEGNSSLISNNQQQLNSTREEPTADANFQHDNHYQDRNSRPASGCSKTFASQLQSEENNEIPVSNNNPNELGFQTECPLIVMTEEDNRTNESDSIDLIDNKLINLDLNESIQAEFIISEQIERDCESRNSRSSNDSEFKQDKHDSHDLKS